MGNYTPINKYNAHNTNHLPTNPKNGNAVCPVCGTELRHADSFEDSDGYRIEHWCPHCNMPVTELFEMIPKGFYYDRPVIKTIDPKTTTVAELQDALRNAGAWASSEAPTQNDIIAVELCGYATSFVSELIDHAVDMCNKLAPCTGGEK